ncbi:uncharacterized protein B0H64DRAFT_7404 [Chaetomium fimeti]|uniref:Uncharacterized protein n=1 Tax=Chaetomium fimeti TaxID=1854472 RepID=A0AAE0HP19_9PEZI|nr:hypothetical protein B0H64DRAFT_7404 [Chaetomium fimeti]
MSGKSDGQGDDHSEYWNPTEQSTSMAPPFRYNTPRSITPKGTLFSNLGEAHQAITSRVVSRPTGSHISDNSLPSSTSTDSFIVNVSGPTISTKSLSSAQHMEPARPSLSQRQRCLTPFRASASASTGWAETPTEPSPIVSGFESSSAGNSVGDDQNNGPGEENRANLDNSESGNSMGDIYDQYYTSPSATRGPRAADGGPPNNTHMYYSEADLASPRPQSPDIRRANTSIGPGNITWQIHHRVDESRQLSLPSPPRVRGNTSHSAKGSHSAKDSVSSVQNFSRPVLSFHSAANLQEPMSAPANLTRAGSFKGDSSDSAAGNCPDLAQPSASPAKSDFVIYGRLPPPSDYENIKDRGYQEGDVSHGGMSNGVSTDSDDDPFKYDRGSFTVFLQPSREREVSAALRFVSTESTESASGIFQDSLSPEPDTPRATQNTNPFLNRLQSYQTTTVDYDWEGGDTPREVKISVRSPPAPPNSPVQPAIGLSEFVEGLGGSRRRKDINTLMSDRADWETVATSVGQFDSNRALASSTGFSGSQLAKVTGSSIADYSDTSSIHVPQFYAFSSSTEQILQPPAPESTHNTFYPRSLNETKRPVFLPKPRIHRVNGYLQNPHRMFTDTTTGSSANSARSALVEKLSASIRSRNARKLAQRRDQYLSQQWSRSKFESLESLSSTYSEQPEVVDSTPIASSPDQNGMTPILRQENNAGIVVDGGGSEQQHLRNTSKELPASPIPREPTAAHLKSRSAAQSRQSPQNFDSPTLFAFPLISLQEAARRKAVGGQNDDDCTITSGSRTQKNSSMDGSRATTLRTTPPTPHITKPIPTHASRPTSASILGISTNRRGYSDYSQDRVVFGHDRGISNVTSYKSGTPLVPGNSALSRFFRPPFEPVADGDASFPGPGNQSVFETPPCLIARDQRNTVRAANLTMSNVRKTMIADLHHISAMEAGTGTGTSTTDRGAPLAFFSSGINDDADAAAYLSWEARKRRQAYYYAMCLLCVVPFFALLVYRGTFNSALSWYTRGETGSLTRRQRRNTMVIGIVFSGVWLVALAVFVTVMVNRKGG